MRILTAICYLLFCANTLAQQTTEIPEGSYILTDVGTYTIDHTNVRNLRWSFTRTYKVLIKTDADVDILKYVAIETSTEHKEELVEANVEVRSPDGGTASFNKSNFAKEPFSTYLMDYNLEVLGLRTNDTLIVSYKTVADLSNRIHRWDIQYAYPVLQSEVSFLLPEEFSYADKLSDPSYLVSETAISNTVELGRSQKLPLKGVRVRCANIPAYEQEAMALELVESRPAFFFALTDLAPLNYDAFLPDWSTQCSDLIVNDYWGKQFRNKVNYNWLAKEASSIFKLNTDDRTRIWKCYEFIHEKFTWDGSMGLFPSYTIDEMQNQREVNKSALNVALLALLKEAGFKAFPVLLNSSDLAPVQVEIPDVNQFNHFVIVVTLGDEVIYLDAGDPHLPIGFIDQSLRREPAVLIQNYKASWVAIAPFESRSMFVTNLAFESDGSAAGEIQCSYNGYDAQSERFALAQDPKARYWKDRAALLNDEIRVDSVRFKNVKNGAAPISSTVYFHIEPGSSPLEIKPFFYSFFGTPILDAPERSNPVIFPFKMHENFVLNISGAEGIEMEFDRSPAKVTLEDGAANIEYLVAEAQGKTELRAMIKINKTTLPVQNYTALKSYFDQVTDLVEKGVVIGR